MRQVRLSSSSLGGVDEQWWEGEMVSSIGLNAAHQELILLQDA
jgi:hypothetical protein